MSASMFARFGNFLIGAENGLEQAGSSPSIDGEEGERERPLCVPEWPSEEGGRRNRTGWMRPSSIFDQSSYHTVLEP